MNQEIKSVLMKTAKIAGVTCVAAGAVALMTTGAALKAIGEGGRYFAGSVKKILEDRESAQEAQEPAKEEVIEAEAEIVTPEEA